MRRYTSLCYTFAYCSSLSELPDLRTSGAEDMTGMLAGCRALAQIPELETSRVQDMSYMFEGCLNLRSVPHLDTSSLLFANYMFHGCSALTSVPCFFLENVITAEGMFKECRSLSELPRMKMNNVCCIRDFVADTAIEEENAPVLTVCSARVDKEDGVRIEYVRKSVPENGVVVLNSILDLTDEIQIAINDGTIKELVINYDVVCKKIGNSWYTNSPFTGKYFELKLRQHSNEGDLLFPFENTHIFQYANFTITFGQRCHSIAGLFLDCSELESVSWFDTNQIRNHKEIT